ncbi:MAG: hypothetical protein AAGC54_08710 [Cyanobacteria bacterium P01_F01_bin.4]
MTASSPSPIRPLNIGNVVSAGLSLYRTNFKTYTGLSLKALLWYLLPIYGWAKSAMIAGQIGRLGFQELIRQPESVPGALQRVSPKMWSFLGVAILVGLIQAGVNIAASMASWIVLFPVALIGGALGDVGVVLTGLINFVVQIILFAIQLWFQARFLVYDLAIAVETDKESIGSISRSWNLSKGSVFRVQGVLLVTYLIMVPLFVLSAVPLLFTIPLFARISVDFPTADVGPIVGLIALAFLAFFVLLLVAGIFTMPFFQSIKSVLYYDLLSRREGLDIQLADRGPTDQRPTDEPI